MQEGVCPSHKFSWWWASAPLSSQILYLQCESWRIPKLWLPVDQKSLDSWKIWTKIHSEVHPHRLQAGFSADAFTLALGFTGACGPGPSPFYSLQDFRNRTEHVHPLQRNSSLSLLCSPQDSKGPKFNTVSCLGQGHLDFRKRSQRCVSPFTYLSPTRMRRKVALLLGTSGPGE